MIIILLYILIVNIVFYYKYNIKVYKPCKEVMIFYKKRLVNQKYSTIFEFYNE